MNPISFNGTTHVNNNDNNNNNNKTVVSAVKFYLPPNYEGIK